METKLEREREKWRETKINQKETNRKKRERQIERRERDK
jgi:hypothetical protein